MAAPELVVKASPGISRDAALVGTISDLECEDADVVAAVGVAVADGGSISSPSRKVNRLVR